MDIGFVGLGAMGLPMAKRLAAAGHRLMAYDVDAGALDQAAASEGVERAVDVATACAGVEIPKPTQTGTSETARIDATDSSTPAAIWARAPVTPVSDT